MLGYVANAEKAETCFGAKHVLVFQIRSTSMTFNLCQTCSFYALCVLIDLNASFGFACLYSSFKSS